MKLLIIGGNGTIGKFLTEHFSKSFEVIVAGRSSDTYQVDISNSASIQELFDKTGMLDAVICAAGEAKWAALNDLTEDDFYIGLKSKLMGQVNVARIGRKYLNKGGSITLTTGILADDPVLTTTSAAMVNGAVHSFVQAAALEFPPTIRINAVSTGVVADAFHKYESYFPGHVAIPMTEVAKAYERSVLGKVSGEIIRRYGY